MELGASLVYLLCLATSALCAILLARAYVRSGARLLLWSAICFALLALNNLLVVVDIMVVPDWDLTLLRNLASLIGMTALLYSFIWDTD
jgi:hypothetical protein